MQYDDTEGQPETQAAEWRMLRLALAGRLERLIDRRNESADAAEIAVLEKQIDETRAQVRTLRIEESVAQFVEDAERYIIAANTFTIDFDPDRDPDEEVA